MYTLKLFHTWQETGEQKNKILINEKKKTLSNLTKTQIKEIIKL